MTLEQLDAIEKLAVDFNSAAFHDLMAHQALPLVKALREALARCDTLRGLADEKAHEAGLYARRMEQAQQARRTGQAQALREAWAHNEKLIEELKATDVRAAEWLGILEQMARERDEARAEVERLRGIVIEQLRAEFPEVMP